jgi:hypothetical protein
LRSSITTRRSITISAGDLAPDIDALDSGRIAGWARTGKAFKVWPISMGFLDNVCHYIPVEHGNSHFFSASKVECASVAAQIGVNPNFSGYILETSRRFGRAAGCERHLLERLASVLPVLE